MPPTLQAALIPLITIALTSLAIKLKIDAKAYSDNILVIATALAALVVAGIGWVKNFMDAKKILRAEKIVPGITSIPKGSETSARIVINDPTTPDPPKVIEKDTTHTP